ncbi:MAG TPA: hypothetical protein DCF45_12220 [Gammaproteobacteria bacterium]|nr:hypothetical protein [Gammaproteobacteria bacterium]
MSDDQMLTSSSSPTAYLTNDTVGFDIFRGAPNSPGTARLYANGNIEVSNLFGANRIIARMTDTNKIVDSDTGADVEINGTPITINSTADICILSWSGC